MAPFPARLLGAAVLVMLAGACGAGPPDERVLGEQVAADQPVPGAPREPADTSTTTLPTSSTSAPEPASGGPIAAAGPENLRLTLTLDAASVPSGQDVTGTLAVENPTPQEVDITHPSACATEQELRMGGALVSEPSMCAMVITPDRMAGGEVRTWPVRIRTGGLAPGAYEARAGLNLATDLFAPSVTVALTPA